jgi:hypothetical protein
MFYDQTTADIIKNASPNARIVWNYLFLRFGDRIGIAQLLYIGPVAGTEFLTYNINKLYFALEFGYSYSAASTGVANPAATLFYNELNVQYYMLHNNGIVWDTTAAALKYSVKNTSIENIYFGRIVVNIANYIKFDGYRLNI